MKAHYYPLSILFVCVFFISHAQDSIEQSLFEDDTPLELTLKMDLKKLVKDDGPEPEEHEGIISFLNDQGEHIEIPLKAKVRGNYRKKKCSFPPIRLNFPKKKLKGTVFDGQDKLKLVTHCTGNEAYQKYLISEYLVYKMFNAITDKSFRVRMAKINYEDTSGKLKPITRYAFMIEDKDILADRLGGVAMDIPNIHPNNTHNETTDILSVFQYMIGNTDWSIPALHNIKLISPTSPGEILAVPYDFDFCGLVSAPYAVPNQQILNISSVKERIYRGFCREEEEFQKIFDVFLAKKTKVYDVLSSCTMLDDKSKKISTKYIDEFYATITSPKQIKYEFLNKCRK